MTAPSSIPSMRRLVAGLGLPAVQGNALGMRKIAVDRNKPQKPEKRTGIVMGCHVVPLPRFADKKVVRRHLVDGLPHGP